MENIDNKKVYDVTIIGGGPAGLTAAIYTSRANIDTLIVAGQPSGGQLTETTDVENFPGFPNGIQGPELIKLMQEQSVRFGAKSLEENVLKLDIYVENNKRIFKIHTTNQKEILSKSVIIASGASANWLPLESVQRMRGRGVSACATCDGFFFKNKIVAVVGAGDAAMEEATFLTKFASKVYVLVRNEKGSMKASKIMQQRAFENPKIEFLYNTEVTEVLGKDLVSGLKIKTSGVESELQDVQGLFMAIGHTPNTKFLNDLVASEKLKLGPMGYLVPIENTKTEIEGLFVAGDVSDWKYRQAISAAGLGCMAALDVEKYLGSIGE